jgi:hypothetical protein
VLKVKQFKLKAKNQFRRLIDCVALSVATGVFCASAQAQFIDEEHVPSYSPALTAGDKALPLKACKSIDPSPNISLGGHFQCEAAKVEAGEMTIKDRRGLYYVSLTTKEGKRYRMGGKGVDLGFLDSAHSVDLNNDGKPDYVLEFAYHGVGLAATIREFVFLISAPEGYSWQQIPRLRAAATRHLYRDVSGETWFLTTRTAGDAVDKMPASKDGKQHSYWVFEPIVFSKTNGLWARLPQANYPIWVQYTKTPNNKPTDLIEASTIKRVTKSPLTGARGGKMQGLN